MANTKASLLEGIQAQVPASLRPQRFHQPVACTLVSFAPLCKKTLCTGPKCSLPNTRFLTAFLHLGTLDGTSALCLGVVLNSKIVNKKHKTVRTMALTKTQIVCPGLWCESRNKGRRIPGPRRSWERGRQALAVPGVSPHDHTIAVSADLGLQISVSKQIEHMRGIRAARGSLVCRVPVPLALWGKAFMTLCEKHFRLYMHVCVCL